MGGALGMVVVVVVLLLLLLWCCFSSAARGMLTRAVQRRAEIYSAAPALFARTSTLSCHDVVAPRTLPTRQLPLLATSRTRSRSSCSSTLGRRPTHQAAVTAPTSGGRGRSIRRLRRDVDGLLPAVEWEDNIIGQRATVLLGDHVWEEALVIGVAGKSHTLRLADGRDLLISLPDHRVILHAELAHDPMAAGEAAAATDATPSGLPPAAERFGLTLPQRLEIYDKVRELRAGKVAADETLHGWRVELVPRANNETVIDFYVMRPDAPSRSSAYRSFPALEIALDVPAGGSAGGAASPVAADEDAAAAAAPTSEAVGKPPDEATTAADEANSHPGVTCDRSGMCPIIGTRYHLRGEDYDLCQEEWDKLPSDEKLKYDAIPPSEATPMDIVAATEPAPPPPPVPPPAGPYRLFLSTLNSTGFRYVRPVANLGGRSTSGQFECAFYVEGKEHNLANGVKADSGFDSAEEAAYMYASFARNHPIDEHHFPLPFEEKRSVAAADRLQRLLLWALTTKGPLHRPRRQRSSLVSSTMVRLLAGVSAPSLTLSANGTTARSCLMRRPSRDTARASSSSNMTLMVWRRR